MKSIIRFCVYIVICLSVGAASAAEKVVVIPIATQKTVNVAGFAGSWQPDTTYRAGQVVQIDGSSYVALKTHTSGPTSPDIANWSLLAAKGDTGPQGDQGIQGFQGSKGDTGASGITGIQILKPLHGEPITSNTYISYSISEQLQSLTFTRTLLSGTGPASLSTVLTGSDVTAGLHENISLTGGALTSGDKYALSITAVTSAGDTVSLPAVWNLTVDTTAPTLESNTAIQSISGRWNSGDRLIFTFSEPVDTSMYGGLSTFADVMINLPDVSANSYAYFSDASLVWSHDSRILTLTLTTDNAGAGLLAAGLSGSHANARFNPTAAVRDIAGNSDNTTIDRELISKGDIVAPMIVVSSLEPHGTVPTDSVIHYNLSEDLAEGKLVITTQSGGAFDPTGLREWTFDSVRMLGGDQSIDLVAESIPSLVDGAYYSFMIEGKDAAGNRVNYQAGSILADSTPPLPPDASKLFVRNYAQDVCVAANQTDGQQGDYLRLYVDDVLVTQAGSPGPYGSTEIQTIINGLQPIAAGAIISYSYIDGAGNESAWTTDGSMPSPPTTADTDNLGVRLGTTAYQLAADAPIGLSQNVHVAFNSQPDSIVYAGSTDAGGNFTASNNAISSSYVVAGTTVSYVYASPVDDHFSDFSTDDGAIVQASTVNVIDYDFSTVVSSCDGLEVNFTGGVYVPADVGSVYVPADIGFGSATSTVGGYQWPAAILDMNIAPVSTGSPSAFTSTSFYMLGSSSSFEYSCDILQPAPGSSSVYMVMNFVGFTAGAIDQIRFDFQPRGTNHILSYPGKHCVLPATQIEASGTTGGLLSPDF